MAEEGTDLWEQRNVIKSYFITTLFLISFFSPIVFGFALDPFTLYSLTLVTHAMAIMVPSCGVGFKWNQLSIGYSHKIFPALP